MIDIFTEKVKIHVKSTITDLVLAEKYTNNSKNGMFISEDGRLLSVNEIKKECDDVIEYSADGEFSEIGGEIKLSYKESPEIGFDNCNTVITFTTDELNTVVLLRSGEVSTACRFDLHNRRQVCCYETPIMTLQFTIYTKAVHNTVKRDGGAILLDYFIEIHGIKTERNLIFIEVQPA